MRLVEVTKQPAILEQKNRIALWDPKGGRPKGGPLNWIMRTGEPLPADAKPMGITVVSDDPFSGGVWELYQRAGHLWGVNKKGWVYSSEGMGRRTLEKGQDIVAHPDQWMTFDREALASKAKQDKQFALKLYQHGIDVGLNAEVKKQTEGKFYIALMVGGFFDGYKGESNPIKISNAQGPFDGLAAAKNAAKKLFKTAVENSDDFFTDAKSHIIKDASFGTYTSQVDDEIIWEIGESDVAVVIRRDRPVEVEDVLNKEYWTKGSSIN